MIYLFSFGLATSIKNGFFFLSAFIIVVGRNYMFGKLLSFKFIL